MNDERTGGNVTNNESYYEQETKIIQTLINEIPLYIKLYDTENNPFINFMRSILKNNDFTVKSIDELKDVIKNLNLNQLINIYNIEKLSFLKKNKNLVINI